MGIKQPCKNCTKRYRNGTQTCHSTCEDYKEYVVKNKEVNDRIKQDHANRTLGEAKSYSSKVMTAFRKKG